MKGLAVLAALLSLLSDSAFANAWPKDKGKGEIISGAAVLHQRSGLSGGAASQGYSSTHGEYGAFADATLIADLGYGQYASPSGSFSAFDTALAGGRYVLNRWNASILSAELLGGVSAIRQTFRPGSPIAVQGTGILRLAFGDGFDLWGRHAFAGIETGWRWRPGPPADELLLDATFGIEPWSTGLAMIQMFAIAGIGPAGGAYQRYDLVKLQLSLAQRVSENWWVQAGALVTAAGTDAGKAGATLALWWRF